MRLQILLAVLVLAGACGLAQGQEKTAVETPTLQSVTADIHKAPKQHPLLFTDAAGFAALKLRCEKEKLPAMAMRACWRRPMRFLPQPPCKREMEGRRLLGVSRKVLARVSTLAMAHRLSGKRAYLERRAAEMKAAAEFSDWNPSHFLDVAEMTLALAVGYDWLYDALDAPTRKAVAGAILEKGLHASRKGGWWVTASNNWGQVCHGGMIAGRERYGRARGPLAKIIQRRDREPAAVDARLCAERPLPRRPGLPVLRDGLQRSGHRDARGCTQERLRPVADARFRGHRGLPGPGDGCPLGDDLQLCRRRHGPRQRLRHVVVCPPPEAAGPPGVLRAGRLHQAGTARRARPRPPAVCLPSRCCGCRMCPRACRPRPR